MSDELPQFESDHAPIEGALIGSSNGVHHDDAGAVATAVATDADASTADADAPTIEAADSTGSAGAADSSDPADDVPSADALDGATGSAIADAAPDDGSGFLANLVRAMQTTAASERTRLAEDADRRRDVHLAAVEARRAAEVGRMRELAADDLKGIDSWADDERQRIQAEHDRRAAALQADLETSLAEHGSRIDREVAAIQDAVVTYRADVDAFFTGLDQETDPVAIARQASLRPTFPALEAIGAAEAVDPSGGATPEPAGAAGDATVGIESVATAHPVDGPAVGVAVMADPSPRSQRGPGLAADVAPESDPAPTEASAVAASADGVGSVAATRVSSGGSSPVLQSVPISRPMSWLRRDRDQDHQDH
jgi:hypothetical protein